MSLQEKVGKLLESSLAFKEDAVGMTKLWNRVKDRMYSLDTRQLQMGLGDQVRTLQMSRNVVYVLHNILAVEYDFILLITSNSVDDNNVNFCLSDQYIIMMMYFE